MQKIFYPESIVIIGLSSKPTNIPRLTLENLLRWGYRGRIFGVNARSEDIHVDGIRMFKNIEDLPEIPDLAYCMIPAPLIPDMMERCGKFGIRRMAIPSGGFSEFSEEGKALADKLVSISRNYGIRFVGPNSVTVANTDNGLCLPFVALHKAPKGEMSIISQSGGVALTMLNYLFDEKIGLAKFASIGNKLDLDEVDFLEYYGKDPQTKVICLYLESINRGRKLIETAAGIDKPIIVYKANTTRAGKEAAMSHTAALSSDEAIIDSAFEEAGIIRIDNFLDFIEVTKAFHLPPMKGKRIMVMSPAGGFAVLGADLCEKAGFTFADMGREFYDSLKQFSNAGVINFSNPLDMGDIYDPKLTAYVLYSVMHSDQVDGSIYISQRPQMPQGDNIFQKMFLTDLSKEAWGSILSAGKPLGVCLFGPTRMIQQTKRYVEFPIFNSPEEMITALAIQMKYYERKKLLAEQKNAAAPEKIDHIAAKRWMQDKQGDYGEEALELLASYGIKTTVSRTAISAAEAVLTAKEVGLPVVMKVISPDALHKSDVGGVLLNLSDNEEVAEGFENIRSNLQSFKKNAHFGGVRIQPMAPEGYDMFIGGKQDPSFGPVIFFGMGGIFIEVFKDTANMICPAEPDNIRKKLKNLKSFQVLQGTRGKAAGDIESFIDLVVRVSMLLADFPGIRELDINPVRVFSEGKGSLALDARVRIAIQ
ncbi:MAG: acetate--CoA ligase family protein [Bacillota bacterium]|nr:acetate--CoA ligase family protein [Bacillota bacterium]